MKIETTKTVLKSLQSPSKVAGNHEGNIKQNVFYLTNFLDSETKKQLSPSFTPIRMSSFVNTPNTSVSGTPMNTTAISWRTDGSPNKSTMRSNKY